VKCICILNKQPVKMKIRLMYTTALFMIAMTAFLIDGGHAQQPEAEDDNNNAADTEDFDAFCSSQVKANNCYAPQCISSCGDNVQCVDDCSGGGSTEVCFEGGIKLCSAVEGSAGDAAGGDGGTEQGSTTDTRRQTFQGSMTISCKYNGQCDCDAGSGCSCSSDNFGAVAAGDTCRVTCKGNCACQAGACQQNSGNSSNSGNGPMIQAMLLVPVLLPLLVGFVI
jgi:hypothetical protein